MGICIVVFSVCDNQAADPLFDLIRQEGADHGEDWPEEHWLIDQMDSSDFQWKRILNTHNQGQTLTEQAVYLFSQSGLENNIKLCTTAICHNSF